MGFGAFGLRTNFDLARSGLLFIRNYGWIVIFSFVGETGRNSFPGNRYVGWFHLLLCLAGYTWFQGDEREADSNIFSVLLLVLLVSHVILCPRIYLRSGSPSV